MTTISIEELKSILDFNQGTTKEAPVAAIVKLQRITIEATEALAREASRRALETARLQRHLDRLSAREESAVETGEAFVELGLDSVELANALIALLKEKKTYQLTKDKVELIMFEIYASWLASKKERITVEHPQATPYGPRFWRAYSKMDFNSGDEAVKRLSDRNPGLAVMVRNAANKYYDYSLSDLERYLKKSEPYKKASPAPGGKWNTELSDTDIYRWKKSENAIR